MTRWFLLTGLTKLSPVRCYFIKCLGNPCESKLAEAYNPTFYVHSIGYEPILIIPDGCSSNSSTRRRSGESTTNILSRQLSSSTRIWVHNRHPLKSTLFFKKIWVHYKPPLNPLLLSRRLESTTNILSRPLSPSLLFSLLLLVYREQHNCMPRASFKRKLKVLRRGDWSMRLTRWSLSYELYLQSPQRRRTLRNFHMLVCTSTRNEKGKQKKKSSEWETERAIQPEIRRRRGGRAWEQAK